MLRKVSTKSGQAQPAHFIAHEHLRQTLRCACGGMVTADGPSKWWEKSHYGASFVAHLVTAKCADSIPLYRLEKEFQRVGVPVARSTMTDLFLRSADLLEPLYSRLLELIRHAPLVHADETPKKVQAEGKCRAGYIWDFRGWDELGHFLSDARIPLDNNPAESALRRVALGRKNFLFVGNEEAGA